MDKLKIIRTPTVGGEPLVLTFDVSGDEFLVKNFTDGDIYASLDPVAKKEECALIPPGAAQNLILKKSPVWLEKASNTIKVFADTTSEKGVEVQCLKW